MRQFSLQFVQVRADKNSRKPHTLLLHGQSLFYSIKTTTVQWEILIQKYKFNNATPAIELCNVTKVVS